MKVLVRHKEGMSFEYPADSVRERLDKLLEKCDKVANGYVVLDVSFPYRQRTTGERSQNNLLHFLLAEIAKETGNDLEDVKDGIKERAIKRGYPYHVNPLTNAIKPYSTTMINTVQCSMLIEECYQLVAEYGIILPPNPYGGEDEQKGA